MENLQPRVKTSITGHGSVVLRDVTRQGLQRVCIGQHDQYPDLETWLAMLPPNARVLAHRYTERMTAGVFVGYLWLYFKKGEVDAS
jgi:hypothetical protein